MINERDPSTKSEHAGTANVAGWRRTLLLGAVCTLGALLSQISLPQAAWAQLKPKDFRDGIQLQDTSSWQKSISKMQDALKAAPEDGKPVRIYGNRYQRYLPHYYEGLALYNLKDCQGALQQWDLSLKAGAVQRTPEFQALKLYEIDCQKHALP